MNGVPRIILQRKRRKPWHVHISFGPPVALDGRIVLGHGQGGAIILDPNGAPQEWLDALIDAALDVHPATRKPAEEVSRDGS